MVAAPRLEQRIGGSLRIGQNLDFGHKRVRLPETPRRRASQRLNLDGRKAIPRQGMCFPARKAIQALGAHQERLEYAVAGGIPADRIAVGEAVEVQANRADRQRFGEEEAEDAAALGPGVVGGCGLDVPVGQGAHSPATVARPNSGQRSNVRRLGGRLDRERGYLVRERTGFDILARSGHETGVVEDRATPNVYAVQKPGRVPSFTSAASAFAGTWQMTW